MPRPPTKRNRPTLGISKTGNRDLQRVTDNAGSTKHNPNGSSCESPAVFRMTQRPASDFAPHQKDQTPVVKCHDYAIESSPLEEREAGSSRPVTRARGYSSTLSIVGRKGDGNSRIPGTPAYESSILSNFRRRPRQPSILHMMQANDDSSDLDDEDFLGGLSPEDESTPLDISRGKSLIAGHAASSSPGLPSPSSSKQRKRTPSSGNNCSAPRPQQVRHSPPTMIPGQQDVTLIHLSQPLVSPEATSTTMAPPMSSSPSMSPTITPSLIYAEEPLAVSTIALGIPAERSNVGTSLSTVALQKELLPRRFKIRRQCWGPNLEAQSRLGDDSCSEMEHHESDLPPAKATRAPRRHIGKPGPPQPYDNPPKEQPTHVMAESRKRNRGQTQNNEKTKLGADRLPCATTHASQEGPLSPFSSPSSSPLSSPLSSPPGSQADHSSMPSGSEPLKARYLSEELRVQAQKFADIDKWELDYEDVTIAASKGSDAFR
ncbi:hypothetical protein ASPACDRAFT_110961 [Aspergillus aculeatus ATCC 16872]|uniref:Uncharacterized protein n=1 Tax=Aspergillus aculeatus (strain ATCC 16872 / CBS 172.66 / WB 5094) TaxID=690307 RepID=A0A1L9X4D4_ASPA1|nr:uncharacterized protein ASPACDRAFT_110961 [Aspergillus aculeatus ATCC 16872]OJK03330.1 hypothetical protein ASPACDRAFT_110961 [Aspergillus aculeatus ATCC 16872]